MNSHMMRTVQVVKVGISDLNVVQAPYRIRTSGLGSCVGVVIYDLQMKVAGLSHIMLPDSTHSKQKELNHYKYADTAIPLLLKKLLHLGARKTYVQAKIAGGAQMFQFSNSDVMKIGYRNVQSVREILSKLDIPIVAQDIGGNKGRTIEFDPQTGKLMIRKIGEQEFYI